MNLRARFYTIATAILIVFVIISIYLTQVFITTLLLSVFLVYLLDPVYLYLLRITKNKQISSALTITIASSVILFLIFFVATQLMGEISNLSSYVGAANLKESNLSQAITGFLGRFFPSSIVTLLDGIPAAVASTLVTILKDTASAFVANVPVYLAQLVLLVFFTYYLFTDGRDVVIGFIDLAPEKTFAYRFLAELNLIYNIFFRIHFFVAMISGIIATIGFFFMGIPYPIMWGIILGFFGLLPELGPAALFVPMAIYYLVTYDFIKALEIFVFGEVFLVFIPEYILRPRLVLIGASVHPILTILAFTAPIFVIGPSGIILGPAIYGIALAGYRTLLRLRKL